MMRVFVPVWGAKHQRLLNDALLRSLSWPKNAQYLDNAEWLIVTSSDDEYEQALSSITKHFPKGSAKKLIYPDLDKPKDVKVEAVLLNALEAAIDRCIEKHSPMLMATPDYIFGDGTIACFEALGTKDSCVSMAHMRCLPEVLSRLDETLPPPSNKELLLLGMNFPHDTWTKSQDGLHDGYTVYGGIQWSKLDEKTTLVRHWLPAPFFANFTQDDLDFFKNFKEGYYNNHLYLKTFALWDHLWASRLIDQGRLRLIGSSEAAIMIEITDREKNHPRPNPINMTNANGYILNQPHNHIQKQFVSVWKS